MALVHCEEKLTMQRSLKRFFLGDSASVLRGGVNSVQLRTGALVVRGATNTVRLRTLMALRWTAVVGQLAAIGLATFYFEMILPLDLCMMVVAASILANLFSIYVFPENKRLTEIEALLTLMFDIGQLSLLVILTGGLTNPFILLVLAPVTVSASALRLRTTVILGSTAIVFVTIAALLSIPMRYEDGTSLTIPPLFAFGFWLSIVVGILFIALYARRVATEIRAMGDALLATQMALAREQKLTDLGGVVAAAAHELGTPLATIKLISTELISELGDKPELLEDAQLIRSQADRCRDILRNMGRAGKNDLQMRQAPLESLLREAAEPHASRGKTLHFHIQPKVGATAKQPILLRKPEVIHGLRNLVQNAVDFARSAVWIEAEWSDKVIRVRIVDDGPGYPPNVIGRIGDPFVRSRRFEQDLTLRPEYEGMGLGLFIAKTLLERSGAEMSFSNSLETYPNPKLRPQRCGALVEAVWPQDALVAPADLTGNPNPPIEA